MSIVTHDDYWDCSCETHYIHLKADRLVCPKCNAHENDGMPDSRVNEMADLANHFIAEVTLK